jgi:ELWxxDGT repeat protein
MVDRVLFSADDGNYGQALWISDGTALGTTLVADIYPGINAASIRDFALLGGGRALFIADDGTSGEELWITDGGPGGTSLVKDIRPGAYASSISNITALGNGMAVFQANDGTTGRELWATDGTEAGTLRLADMVAGTGNSASTSFAVLGGGRALFTGTDGTNGTELWITDGTIAGTSLFKDIRTGSLSSSPSSFTALSDGRILFRATGSTAQGQELWITDGTAEGTVLLKEIRPGNGATSISQITELGDGRTLFSANDGTHGGELWITDGTTAGTVLVRDIDPTSSGSGVELITPLGDGRALFQADDGTNGPELWITDGTEAGTSLLFDLKPGAGDPYFPSVREIVSLGNGTAVFAGDNGANGLELWVTDGTTAGTSLLRDIMPGSADSSPGDFVAMGDGTAFFVVDDPVVGAELWVTDGTLGGTHLAVDVNTLEDPNIGAYPMGIQSTATGEAIFVANDGTGFGVWITDGSSGGTVRLQGGLDGPYQPFAFRLGAGVTLFAASTTATGVELWATDGTTAGTSLLKDINPGGATSYPGGFLALGDGTALFSADDGTAGFELWITDGTADGTTLFKDINPGIGNSYAYQLTALGNGQIIFTANDGTNGDELWVTDGTEGGTLLLKDINAGAADGSPFQLTAISGNRALFTALGADGIELWVTDGTEAGTVQVKDIVPGTDGSTPQGFAALGNGQTLFKAQDGLHGLELWTTDGTEAGTTQVKDILTGSDSGMGNNGAITALGNGLAVFAANDGTTGTELWVTDGTEGGTSLLKDIRVGTYGSSPYLPVALGDGTALFFANDGVHGYELWRTDGTAGGTSLLKDIRPGAYGSRGSAFEVFSLGDGRIIFTANDGLTGSELWVSDGTEAGTVQVKDILTGVTRSAEVGPLFLLPENIAADAPTGLDIAAILDTGISDTDNITSTANLTVTGLAAPDVLVTLKDGTTVVGQVRSDAVTGAWSITPAALADGTHRFTATALNASLNTSASSATLTVHVDNTDPVVAITSAGGTVAVATQTITGTLSDAHAGTTVSLFSDGGVSPIATATVGLGGAWSVSVDLGADGPHELVARSTDLAGNLGSSAPVTYTVNTTLLPPVLDLASASDNGASDTDDLTGITTPTLVGTAAANALVSVFDGATLLGTTGANGVGAWSFTTSSLAAGAHALSATQTLGGSTSAAATLDVTIDLRLQTGTAGNEVFTFASQGAFTDPVRWVDGLGGIDTLQLNFVVNLTDAAFSGLHNLERIILGAAGAQSLVLGTNAAQAFGARLEVIATTATSLNLDGSALGSGTALVVTGGAGNDSLVGGAGRDILKGGLGADQLTGGLGDDLFYVEQAGDAALEATSGGYDRIIASLDWVLGEHLEWLSLVAGAAVNGTGNALANRIDGNANANLLTGGEGADRLYGLAGSDTLIGGVGADALDGGLGADRLEGGADNDVYSVNDLGDVVVELVDGGYDRIAASVNWVLGDHVERLSLSGNAALTATGNALANIIDGNAGSNVIDGRDGADVLSGLAGNDTVLGGLGADTLSGGTGADSLEGGADNDTYSVDDLGDVVVEQTSGGYDRVITTVDWVLEANVERLSLGGVADLDGTGNELANRLDGNAGANRLDGAGGNDVLIGGGGADELQGGLGADRFIFQSAADANGDVIMDFSAAEADRIELQSMDANANLAGNQTFAFIGSSAFGGIAGQLRFGGGFLQGDVSGDGVADFQIELTSVASLAAANIWL